MRSSFQCVEAGGTFANPDTVHFDNIGNAMLCLIEVSSLEGWGSVMFSAMDIVDNVQDPCIQYNSTHPESTVVYDAEQDRCVYGTTVAKENCTAPFDRWLDREEICMLDVASMPWEGNSWYFVFYFFCFVVVCAFFVLQLFVGVIVDNISRASGSALITESQAKWIHIKKHIRHLEPKRLPPPPGIEPGSRPAFTRWNSFRRVFYAIVVPCDDETSCPYKTNSVALHYIHSWLETFLLGVIFFNAAVMCAEYYTQSVEWLDLLGWINFALLIVYTVEMAVKLFGLGFRGYVTSPWNIFDGLLVVGSWALTPVKEKRLAMMGRVFRIGRVFRMIKKAKGLRILFKTLVLSLPALGNITLLLFLVFFVFAVLGIQLFGSCPAPKNR